MKPQRKSSRNRHFQRRRESTWHFPRRTDLFSVVYSVARARGCTCGEKFTNCFEFLFFPAPSRNALIYPYRNLLLDFTRQQLRFPSTFFLFSSRLHVWESPPYLCGVKVKKYSKEFRSQRNSLAVDSCEILHNNFRLKKVEQDLHWLESVPRIRRDVRWEVAREARSKYS